MEKFDIKNIESLPKWKRYGLLKEELRYLALEKDQPGYQSRYFYISLSEMQRIIVPLENKYNLTSNYTERTLSLDGHLRVFAVRELFDITTGEKVTETVIDITNLKVLVDHYGLEKDVLLIEFPKDATNTLYYDFLEAQGVGSISTYMQRYTYNQLYDFQETKEDSIEVKGRLRDQKKPEKEEATAKEQRLADKSAEIILKIKEEFNKEEVINLLKEKKAKLGTMNEEEALAFYNELLERKNKGEEK